MRHATRHVHQTIVERVRAIVEETGWKLPPVNFGAKPVQVQEIEPKTPTTVEPNVVAVTIDSPDSPRGAELGDGLMVRQWALYLDVLGENWSTTMAIAEDLIDKLAEARIPVRDFARGVDTEHMIHIDELDIDEPPAAGQLDRSTWRVVTGTIEVYFTGES